MSPFTLEIEVWAFFAPNLESGEVVFLTLSGAIPFIYEWNGLLRVMLTVDNITRTSVKDS